MKAYEKDKRICNAIIRVSKGNTVPDTKLISLALDSIFEQNDGCDENA